MLVFRSQKKIISMTRGYVVYIKQRALHINQTELGRSNENAVDMCDGKGGRQ